MRFISHTANERYSVANTAEILIQHASYDDALQALLTAGVAGEDATYILNHPAKPSTWTATVLAALGYSIEDIGATLKTLPTSEVTDQLEARLLDIADTVQALAEQTKADKQQAANEKRRERLAELEAEINAAIPAYREHLRNRATGVDTSKDANVRELIILETVEGAEYRRLLRGQHG